MNWKCTCGKTVELEDGSTDALTEHAKACTLLRRAVSRGMGSAGAKATNSMMTADQRHFRAIKAVRQREKNRAEKKAANVGKE